MRGIFILEKDNNTNEKILKHIKHKKKWNSKKLVNHSVFFRSMDNLIHDDFKKRIKDQEIYCELLNAGNDFNKMLKIILKK